MVMETKYVELININEEQMNHLKNILNDMRVSCIEHDTPESLYFSDIAEDYITFLEDYKGFFIESLDLRNKLVRYLANGYSCAEILDYDIINENANKWIKDFFNDELEEKVNHFIDSWEKRTGLTVREENTRKDLIKYVFNALYSYKDIVWQDEDNYILETKAESAIYKFFSKGSC